MLTVLDTLGNSVPLDIDPAIELENIQAILEADFNIPPEHQQILFQGRALPDTKASLASYGVKDGDLLVVQDKRTNIAMSRASSSIEDSGVGLQELLRQQIINSSAMQNDLRQVRVHACSPEAQSCSS